MVAIWVSLSDSVCMPNGETILLTPESDEEILASVDQLYTDKQVGGIVLKGFVDPSTLPNYTIRDGKGLQNHPKFKNLAAQLAHHLGGPEGTYSTFVGNGFKFEHPWHLGLNSQAQQLRFWFHLSGEATFSVSRAASTDIASCYGVPEEWVLRDSYARPVDFTPEPGDILAFIDKGYEPLDAPSSFHKVDVPHDKALQRLSTAYDLTFS